jgi:hypothetical protein
MVTGCWGVSATEPVLITPTIPGSSALHILDPLQLSLE